MKIIYSIFLIPFLIFSQNLSFKGKISDSKTNIGLPYANLRIVDTNLGTSANINGEFELRINSGKYKLISSYIGYKSDTLSLELSKSTYVDIYLDPTAVEISEVTITPGENPAIPIIKKSIEKKERRNEKLNSYAFSIYTKGLVRTAQDISSDENRVGVELGSADTSELKITGIIENVGKGFFKKPNNYKEEIVAQKQTSNFNSQMNILTGGRIIQNFYGDDIQFFGRPLIGPLSTEALEYYYYYIEDILKQDDKKVYQIYFATEEEHYPGFWGRLYIVDETFDLIKIDAHLNSAANPGGFFTKVNIFQQFYKFDGIYMPVDYRLFVEGNALGLMKFGFEVNSILYEYKINNKFDEDFFDMVILKVLPNADQKDSSYWKNIQTIPSTLEEQKAYERIDSVEAIPKTFWDRFSFLSSRITITDNFSVSGLMDLYHFNKVEGHALDFGLFFRNRKNKRLNVFAQASYGFSDKKFKKKLFAEYKLGEFRTQSIQFGIHDKIASLFNETDNYNRLTSTVLSLISKYDFRDYYYKKGFYLKWDGEVFPILRLSLGIENRTDNSAVNNTDFSFFYKNRKYKPNQPIYETRMNAFTAGFKLDFRKYIEDGYYRRRTSQGRSYIVFNGDFTLSDKQLLASDEEFRIYKFNASGRINTFKSASLGFDINLITGEGAIPFQMLYSLPGNINASSKNYSFRTLRLGEVYGDRIFSANIKHNFMDELFILSGIPLIKSLQLQLSAHFGIAWSRVSTESSSILPVKKIEYRKPLLEIGFSLGQIMIPFNFDFTWKLTHRSGNNFVFGVNAFVL